MSPELLIFLVTGVSATSCPRSFHSICCDFVAAERWFAAARFASARVLVTVTGPFRRVCETRREQNERCPARPIRIRWHPTRSDRGSCRRHGRPPHVPCLFWCRGGVLHLQVQAGVPAPNPSAPRDATPKSPGARWFSRKGDPRGVRAPAPRRARQGSWSRRLARRALPSE